MKHLLILFLSAALIACTSCKHEENNIPECDSGSCPLPSASAPVETGPPDAPTETVVSDDGWELTIPNHWIKTTSPQEIMGLEIIYLFPDKQELFFLVKNEFLNSNDEYVLEAIRGLRDDKADLNSIKQVEVNGDKFILIDSRKAGIRMWMWLTVKNKFGYALSCGGFDDPTLTPDDCVTVANSLKLK